MEPYNHSATHLTETRRPTVLSPVTAIPSLLCSSLPRHCCLTSIILHASTSTPDVCYTTNKISYMEVGQRSVSSWKEPANSNSYILCGFKTSGDTFRLPYSIAFDCSIPPFSDLFHPLLYISHLSRFFAGGLVVFFPQVSS